MAAASYGFHGRLRAEFPSQVVADTTEVCNLACVHCTHPEFKRSEHYRARMLEPDLNRKMVDEVREQGGGITQYIRYSGNGEPLLNRHIFEMLGYATKNSGTIVTLTTNGTLLNEARTEQLLATGVSLVDISLDAFRPETYAQIRVNGDLAETSANVRRLIARVRTSGSRTKVVVSFIEQPQNTAEIPEFELFWRDQGAHQVVVRRLHTNANSSSRVAALQPKPASDTPRRACLYPWERILLTPSGQLAFCPQDWIHASAVADYRTTTIRETWQGEFYRRLREAHLSGNYCDHRFCAQCPDWRTTRWPGEGLSYADLVENVQGQRT
ncbi:MAG TPA: radical SAM/SPASM domain-containing protein [Opitutaceae bacterium]|nr:radical SAM/SPASM domain-containing protein [Opitutaceae bacterium]HWB97248.1 radical SAM/SPASM domain-containing protein [Bryobacteraceae bacterium]